MTAGESNAYRNGILTGLRAFAWWKDDVQYVGTCGTTLEEAEAKVEAGQLWNQITPEDVAETRPPEQGEA